MPTCMGSQTIMTAQNLTNTQLSGRTQYRKTATNQAVQIHTEFIVDTLEGTFAGKSGDWLAEGIEGERSIIDDDIFNKIYMEVWYAR